jgi:hypothetical protein
MTNVKTGWGGNDEANAIRQGWYVYASRPSPWGYASAVRCHAIAIVGEFSPARRGGEPVWVSLDEATTHVMTQMLAGDALCYKAMRIVCKTNPAYESYKPMVRAVRVKYGF